MEAYDLITMGGIGVDLYPLQTGVPLPQVTSFGKFPGGGGSATNVAVAAARLGRRTAVITRTGDDPFGAYLHQALHRGAAAAGEGPRRPGSGRRLRWGPAPRAVGRLGPGADHALRQRGGGIVASRLECSSEMPTADEVEAAITAGAVL